MYHSSVCSHSNWVVLTVVVLLNFNLPLASAQRDGAGGASEGSPAAGNQLITIDDLQFTVPHGFQIEKIAGEPLIKWPVVADWDPQGRLVVVESGGVSRPIDQHNRQQLHRVVRLVDDDGDGTFDSRMLAAENLPFAEGVLCVGNSLLVAAPPHILLLTDANGDGHCETREVWFDGQTITGCANDLHGPYEGRDGWIYWCKGAFAEQTHALLNGERLVSSAAHIFRRRFEGGPIEPVMTGGMDNPVEVAFTPAGERFFTSTFLQHPRDGLRDGIAHAIYGGVYGKPHHVIDGHRRTGDLMPIMTQLGAAAPSGLAYLQSPQLAALLFPDQYDVLAAALFNHHKVTLHHLVPDGAGFRTDDRDLLVADRIDFHPTDIVEGRDGSLIVVDTGGWYDLCCPSSRVDQKAAGGGLYRISAGPPNRQTVVPVEKPRDEQTLARVKTNEAETSRESVRRSIEDLHASDPILRRSACVWLCEHPEQATPLLIEQLDNQAVETRQRIDALWCLCRIGSPAALASVAQLLREATAPASLLSAASHAVGLHHDETAAPALAALILVHRDPHVRRAAAEALGRTGGRAAVDPLMRAVTAANGDRILEHSLLFALMELAEPEAVSGYLSADDPLQVRAAMLVLDQLTPGSVPLESLFSAARAAQPQLRETALSILRTRPQSPNLDSLEQIESAWQRGTESNHDREILLAIIGGWGEQPAIQLQLSKWIEDAPQEAASRQDLLLELLEVYAGSTFPAAWTQPLAHWLATTDRLRTEVIVRGLRNHTSTAAVDSALVDVLLRRASEFMSTPESTLTILAALPQGTAIPESLADLAVSEFVDANDEARALIASQALTRVRLPVASAQHLLQGLDTTQPLRLPIALAAINRCADDSLDADMLARLGSLRSARTLADDQLISLYRNRSQRLQEQARAVMSQLREPTVDVRSRVEEVLGRLQPGDPLKGYQVFRSSQAACSACHRIGYIGKSIGPDLTQIGRSRTRYDLLEAILYPSARLEQSYQPLKILTVDGQVVNGLVKQQTSQGIELITGPDQVVVLAHDDIEQSVLSEVSIMPAGLDEQISIEDLSHLMALLEATR